MRFQLLCSLQLGSPPKTFIWNHSASLHFFFFNRIVMINELPVSVLLEKPAACLIAAAVNASPRLLLRPCCNTASNWAHKQVTLQQNFYANQVKRTVNYISLRAGFLQISKQSMYRRTFILHTMKDSLDESILLSTKQYKIAEPTVSSWLLKLKYKLHSVELAIWSYLQLL